MAIIKSITLPNGVAAAFHKVIKVTLDWPSEFIQVDIRSYADEAAFNSESPFIYQWRTILSSSSLTDKVNDDLETLLVRDSSELSGGYVVDNTSDLGALKARRWIRIKQARTAFIDAPLATPYGTFDSDAAGRTSITDAVLLANNLSALSLPVAIEFTLADNSSVTLNAEQIIEVGILLGQKVQQAHPHSQALRKRIDTATTKEEVEAVVW